MDPQGRCPASLFVSLETRVRQRYLAVCPRCTTTSIITVQNAIHIPSFAVTVHHIETTSKHNAATRIPESTKALRHRGLLRFRSTTQSRIMRGIAAPIIKDEQERVLVICMIAHLLLFLRPLTKWRAGNRQTPSIESRRRYAPHIRTSPLHTHMPIAFQIHITQRRRGICRLLVDIGVIEAKRIPTLQQALMRQNTGWKPAITVMINHTLIVIDLVPRPWAFPTTLQPMFLATTVNRRAAVTASLLGYQRNALVIRNPNTQLIAIGPWKRSVPGLSAVAMPGSLRRERSTELDGLGVLLCLQLFWAILCVAQDLHVIDLV